MGKEHLKLIGRKVQRSPYIKGQESAKNTLS